MMTEEQRKTLVRVLTAELGFPAEQISRDDATRDGFYVFAPVHRARIEKRRFWVTWTGRDRKMIAEHAEEFAAWFAESE